MSGGGGQRFSKGLQEKIASEWNEEPGKEERGKMKSVAVIQQCLQKQNTCL